MACKQAVDPEEQGGQGAVHKRCGDKTARIMRVQVVVSVDDQADDLAGWGVAREMKGEAVHGVFCKAPKQPSTEHIHKGCACSQMCETGGTAPKTVHHKRPHRQIGHPRRGLKQLLKEGVAKKQKGRALGHG